MIRILLARCVRGIQTFDILGGIWTKHALLGNRQIVFPPLYVNKRALYETGYKSLIITDIQTY